MITKAFQAANVGTVAFFHERRSFLALYNNRVSRVHMALVGAKPSTKPKRSPHIGVKKYSGERLKKLGDFSPINLER